MNGSTIQSTPLEIPHFVLWVILGPYNLFTKISIRQSVTIYQSISHGLFIFFWITHNHLHKIIIGHSEEKGCGHRIVDCFFLDQFLMPCLSKKKKKFLCLVPSCLQIIILDSFHIILTTTTNATKRPNIFSLVNSSMFCFFGSWNKR